MGDGHRVGLVVAALLLGGCAYGRVVDVSAPEPDVCGKLIVDVESSGLFQRKDECEVEAIWAGYKAQSPVDLTGADPDRIKVELKDWSYVGVTGVPLNKMEVRFMLKNRIINRKRIAPLFSSPEVLNKPCAGEAAEAAPAEAAAPAAVRPKGWPAPGAYSATLDKPTRQPLSKEIVCELDAESGPRYIALDQTPDAVVKLVIDVVSKGKPQFREVTFWSIELLDEDGLALPHTEEGRVDLGGQNRITAEWRLDGSPVVLKLQSFSGAGDWLRIRFE